MHKLFQESKWLADENIDDELVAFIRTAGIDIISIKEMNWFGKTDSAILEYAFQKNMVVITQDADFGNLATLFNEQFYGIIYLRPGHFNPLHHTKSLAKLFEVSIHIEIPFIVVIQNKNELIKIRVRLY